MSHFNDYEADQSRLYNLHHVEDKNSSESHAKVKKIWMVTLVLAVVTIVEVLLGLYMSGHVPKAALNTVFIILTLVKAYFIVSIFMHLGDELKGMKLSVYIPLSLFLWFILAFLADGSFWLKITNDLGFRPWLP